MKTYAVAGPHNPIPLGIVSTTQFLVRRLADANWIQRNGISWGYDEICLLAAVRGSNPGIVDAFQPYASFRSELLKHVRRRMPNASEEARRLSEEVHPNWGACTNTAKRLLSRSAHTLLGEHLDDPVAFLICWTHRGLASGGTGHAIRLADRHGIPVYNLYDPEAAIRLMAFAEAF